jgi:hypothetical protein
VCQHLVVISSLLRRLVQYVLVIHLGKLDWSVLSLEAAATSSAPASISPQVAGYLRFLVTLLATLRCFLLYHIFIQLPTYIVKPDTLKLNETAVWVGFSNELCLWGPAVLFTYVLQEFFCGLFDLSNFDFFFFHFHWFHKSFFFSFYLNRNDYFRVSSPYFTLQSILEVFCPW